MLVSSKFDTYVKRQGVSFAGIIESYLTQREKFHPYNMEINRNKIVGFHPSALHNACARQLAFGLLDEAGLYKQSIIEDEFNDGLMNNNSDLQFIFDEGHTLHGLIQYGYLPDIKGLEYSVENPLVHLYDKYLIGGTDDLEVVLQDKKLYLSDIKTMKEQIFHKTKDVSKIDFNYITQINLYMLGRRIPRAFFFLINKNNSKPIFKEFFLQFDRAIVKEPLTKALTAKSFIYGKNDIDILPECKKQSGKFNACKYSSLCFRCTDKSKLVGLTKHKSRIELVGALKDVKRK